MLLPADGLGPLLASAGEEAVTTLGRVTGRAMGLRIAERLRPEGARASSMEGMVSHLGAELALAGLGSLSIERWGHALVIVVDHCPLAAGGDALLEAILSEAVGVAAERRVSAVHMARDGARARFLLTNGSAADRARQWLRTGATWGEVLSRLHSPPPAEGSQPS